MTMTGPPPASVKVDGGRRLRLEVLRAVLDEAIVISYLRSNVNGDGSVLASSRQALRRPALRSYRHARGDTLGSSGCPRAPPPLVWLTDVRRPFWPVPTR